MSLMLGILFQRESLCKAIFLGLALSFSQYALSQLISSGSIEPVVEEPLLPSPVDEGLISVPAPVDSPSGLLDGPSLTVLQFFLTYDHKEEISLSDRSSVTLLLEELIVKHKNKFTLGQLSVAAEVATQHLRKSGYLLARVIVPPQEVEKQTVHLRIFVGILGDVAGANHDFYSTEQVTHVFDPLINEVVLEKQIEEGMLRVNDIPGLSAVAVMRPGQEVGETELAVRSVSEKPIEFSVRLDNYQAETTGDIRALAGVRVNNITGHIDSLSVDLIKTFDPGDLRNARVNYEITHPDLVHTLGLVFSKTKYDVEGADSLTNLAQVKGDTEIGQLYFRSSWVRQRNHNISTSLGLATKRTEVELDAFNTSLGIDRLTVFTAGLVADGVDRRFRGLHRGTLTFHRGFNDFIGSMDSAGNGNSLTQKQNRQILPGQFSKVSATYNRSQALTRNHSLLFRFAGQYSDDQLSTLEKMNLGGPYTVRAYPIGEFVSDRATFTSLAWEVNGGAISQGNVFGEYSWADVLTLSLFADYAWGKNRSASGAVTRREIDGWGASARFRFPAQKTYVELALARPFGGEESATNFDDGQVWFIVGAQF